MHEGFYFLITCTCFISFTFLYCLHHFINQQRIKNFTLKKRYFKENMSLTKTHNSSGDCSKDQTIEQPFPYSEDFKN